MMISSENEIRYSYIVASVVANIFKKQIRHCSCPSQAERPMMIATEDNDPILICCRLRRSQIFLKNKQQITIAPAGQNVQLMISSEDRFNNCKL